MAIKVLLVDDEKDYIVALAKQLKVRGFEVDTVFGGDEALAVLEKKPYDIIVLDVLMPKKSGIETFDEINRRFPKIPVIMHTGHAKVETAIQGMKKGAFDYVIKPIQLDELIKKIELANEYRNASAGHKVMLKKKPGLFSRWFQAKQD